MTHDARDELWLRTTLGDIAGSAVVDADVGRPAARRALKRRSRQRAQRRGGTAFAVIALVVVAVLSRIGDTPDHTLKTVTAPTTTTASGRRIPTTLKVLERLEGGWAPEPIAYDGRDVWLAHENRDQTSTAGIVIERRDSTSGRLLSSVVVPQEAVASIAVAAGSIWVAGGGDGGVPHTTVSRIDAATGHVVFTHTLTTQSCSCSLAAGAGGVWLGGQGSEAVVRLDVRTGEVTAVIALPHPSFSIAVVGDRVQVGLDDSRVAVIDPATNRVERVITLATPTHPAFGVVDSIASAATSGASDSWVTRGDGISFEITQSARLTGRVAVFLRPLGVTSASVAGRLLWAVGVDQVLVDDVGARGKSAFADYDRDQGSFSSVTVRSDRFVPSTGADTPLDRIVATGSTLWIAELNGPILLVRTA